MVDEPRDVEFADDLGSRGLRRDITDQVDIDHEQHDVSRVELPDALEDAGCSHDVSALDGDSGVDNGCGIAGDEDEQIGRAAEAEIAQGQRADRVVGDVVQEQKPVRDAEQQGNPEIAIACRDLGLDRWIH